MRQRASCDAWQSSQVAKGRFGFLAHRPSTRDPLIAAYSLAVRFATAAPPETGPSDLLLLKRIESVAHFRPANDDSLRVVIPAGSYGADWRSKSAETNLGAAG